MNWDNHLVIKPKWNGEIINKEKKLELAKKVAAMVKEGQVIGFGSGSTSFLAFGEIAKRMEDENLHITAIPTSKEVEMLCHYLSIPTTNLLEQKPDWNFDGADEVDEKMAEHNVKAVKVDDEDLFGNPLREGYDTGKWILLDFNGIVVHIFSEDERDYYNLDKIWSDAKTLDLKALQEM